MEGLPAVYAGTRSTCTFGPKYGGVGVAEAAGVMNTNRLAANKAIIMAVENSRTDGTRDAGAPNIAMALPRPGSFVGNYIIGLGRLSKTKTRPHATQRPLRPKTERA